MEKKILSFEDAKLKNEAAMETDEDADDLNDMILTMIDAAFDESDISDEMSPEAMYRLAFNAFNDEYKKSNIGHILAYMKKSAKMGYVPSMLFLGKYFLKGEEGREADYHESFKWYKMAADNLSAEGAYNCAKLIEEGKGVKKNLKAALDLYKK
ncbi:MAG: tetratricopeptide repeat protein [Phascolarctobacterium sp.]